MTTPPLFVPSAEQSLVLDHGAGPLRIAAGAGTGKTTTLAHRIHGLIHSGVDAERILGITFTNRAADELAQRIRDVTGRTFVADREVEVHTYHGFAAQILHEFGPLAGMERGTPVITPTFARQLFRDSIEGGVYTHLDITYRGVVDHPAKLAADLADNLMVPDDLRAATPEPAGEIWEKRLEILGIVERYEHEKRRLGVVDYGDLIRAAHTVLAEHPTVAGAIRSRYEAVFLDEYQDTNPAQRQLLRLLFDGGFSVTAVGDPDQTIYEWRGASLENFAAFPTHFAGDAGSPAPTVPLSINRRSGQRILDVANLVRAEISGESRVPLRAAAGAPAGTVEVAWLGTALDEAAFIADRMIELHDGGTPWREMAVLFRKNKDIEVVRGTLEEHDIPVEVANLGGLLDIPEVADVHAWLRMLDDPADSAAAVRILMGGRYRLGMGDLRPLASWARSGLDDDTPAVARRTLLEAIDRMADIPEADRLAGRAREALAEFATSYRDLLEAAQGVSLVELVRRIISDTGMWQEVEAMRSAARLSARLNLYRFLDLAEEWSPLEGRPSLRAFVDYLAVMQEDQNEELDTARLSGEDAVALLTVHRAKGLEWDAVFVPAVYHNNFPSSARLHEDPYRFAQILPYRLRLDAATLPTLSAEMAEKDRKDVLSARHLAQEWRIAYVAVTRARRHLAITGAHWYGGLEPRRRQARPSALYELAEAQPGVLDRGRADAPPRPTTLRPESLAGSPDPVFGSEGWDGGLRAELAEPGWARRRAADLGVVQAYDDLVAAYQETLFGLPLPPDTEPGPEQISASVTSLVTYAACPRRYYWTDVDPLPRRPSAAARHGVDVHRRIELHNRGAVPLDDVFDELYDLTPEDRSGRRPPADAFRTFLASRFSEKTPVHTEVPFELRVGDARIRGRIDAIYGSDGTWEIVDFKSGSAPDRAVDTLQLEAYGVAAHRGLFGPTPDDLTVTFAYLGGEEPSERSFAATPEWLSTADARLAATIGAIRARRFEPVPQPGCRSCDFVTFCPEGQAFVAGPVNAPDRPRPRGSE